MLKIEGHLSYKGKVYNEFKTLFDKQSVEEVLIQKVVEMTTQTLYDKGLFDKYGNKDEVLNYFLFERGRPDLVESN